MLTSRFLVNLKFSCGNSLNNSFSSSGKYHVIRILNTENKYLYGNLVETQKQRRRKISKALETESDTALISTSKSAGVKKKIEIEDGFENEILDKGQTKLRIKRSKAFKNISSEGSRDSKASEEPAELSDGQFIFKSAVEISTENYPIINPEKCQMFSKDCVVKNVYNYSFNDPAVKTCLTFPSVSKIIEDTMSEKNKQILEKWRLNMVKELGEEGFCKQNQATKARGQEFHAAVLQRVLGEEVGECSEVVTNALTSLSWMLNEVSHPVAVESVISHPTLGYKGVFDCLALFRDIPVVIDWKLSEKPKKDLKDTYDTPVQVTAYMGAINHDPNYKWGVDHGLVAVAYTNGDPCDVFLLAPKHCQIYWKHWLQRLEKFKARSHLHLDHDIDEKALLVT